MITNKWTHSSPFDVGKNNVWVCSLCNLSNLVKALLDSMSNVCSFEANNKVFVFYHQQMHMLEFVRCSIKWCSTHYYETIHTLKWRIKNQNSLKWWRWRWWRWWRWIKVRLRSGRALKALGRLKCLSCRAVTDSSLCGINQDMEVFSDWIFRLRKLSSYI